jgi:hypothetical protein
VASEEEFLEEKASLGEVLESYRRLAIALNIFPKNKEISIKELADQANVHWVTARKALVFFDLVKTVIPRFELTPNFRFEVIERPSALGAVDGIFESSEMRILTKMMLCRAISPESARSLNEILKKQEFSTLEKLTSKGFVNVVEGRYYLSRRGISFGSIGLKKITDLGIPLPWEQTKTVIPTGRLEPELRSPMVLRVGENMVRPTYHAPSLQDVSIGTSEGWKWGPSSEG